MTTYHSHKVNLSEGQMKKLSTAHNNKSGITIRLSKSDLTGNDSLMLTKRQINKSNKAKKSGVGSDLKISQTQIRKVFNVGKGAPRMGLFPSIGVSVPKPRSRRSTTTNRNQSTDEAKNKKEGGRILSERDALSYRSPPFIGTWDEYNKFLKTGGLVLPKKKDLEKKKYFCLYFLHQALVYDKEYHDILMPLSMTDTMYNESFIINYFKNI